MLINKRAKQVIFPMKYSKKTIVSQGEKNVEPQNNKEEEAIIIDDEVKIDEENTIPEEDKKPKRKSKKNDNNLSENILENE